MPKPDDRGSLMNLKANLPKVAPIEATEEMEIRIMGAAGPGTAPVTTERRKDVSTPIRTDAPAIVGARPPRREGTILLNAKIPLSLHLRLKRTSQYNDISMTDILLRGIEAELESGRYVLPPENWGSDGR